MATFTVDTKALYKIQDKFKKTAELYKAHAVQEINKAVKAMEIQASSKASNLPKIASKAKKPYNRTGNLSRSVSSTPYQNGYASFSMGNNTVRYAPYVEFGTGKGFGIPTYKFSTKNPLTKYASKFRGSGLKSYNMPNRPFFFKTFDEKFATLLKSLKSYKVK
jgi:HK97 gp10 family phage protein